MRWAQGAGNPEARRPTAGLLQLAGLPPGPRHAHPRRLLTGRRAARPRWPRCVRGVGAARWGRGGGWGPEDQAGVWVALTALCCCKEASPSCLLPRRFPHPSWALTRALNDSFLNEGCGGGKQWKERPSARSWGVTTAAERIEVNSQNPGHNPFIHGSLSCCFLLFTTL